MSIKGGYLHFPLVQIGLMLLSTAFLLYFVYMYLESRKNKDTKPKLRLATVIVASISLIPIYIWSIESILNFAGKTGPQYMYY